MLTSCTGGHLHDGGDNLKVLVNGMTICESKAEYVGTTGDGKWATIKEMSQCKEPTKVKKGDILTIKATYDLDQHPAYVPSSRDPFNSTNTLTVEHTLMEIPLKRWELQICNSLDFGPIR
jgi:hypothetical protein